MKYKQFNLECWPQEISQNHRMARVGRDLKDHPPSSLQPHCHRQGPQPPHLILDQAAQDPIQPGPEHLQGRGIHNLNIINILTPKSILKQLVSKSLTILLVQNSKQH